MAPGPRKGDKDWKYTVAFAARNFDDGEGCLNLPDAKTCKQRNI